MAEILPLKAWRYSDQFTDSLDELTAPLFDVVSQKQRQLLYENPLNSIHLSVPKGDNPAEKSQNLLSKWKSEGILSQDSIPGIYVYYQYFRLPGEHSERCRKGFMAHIKAYEWEEKTILRHENTIISAVNDRIDLLKATKIQASPTHGLYEDELCQLEPYMDAAIASPISEIDDYQGVREVIGVIHDAKVIAKFLEVLKSKKIILADGHHRLQGAIDYRREMKDELCDSTWRGSDYHLMYLTNVTGNHIKILPTHRLFYGMTLSSDQLLKEMDKWFTIKKFSDPEDLENYAFHIPGTFGLMLEEESFLLQIKEEKKELSIPKVAEPIRKLDLSILHEVLFHRVLGINPEEQRASSQISYERNLARCIREVRSGKASFAVITRELEMAQVMEVCNSGEVMPQKSTYFYPKALGGLLFASIDQKEFEFNYGAFFTKTKG